MARSTGTWRPGGQPSPGVDGAGRHHLAHRAQGRSVTGRQDVTQIEAKPVVYPGALKRVLAGQQPVIFRSRLEADWAHTLDTLRIEWVYEPHLFTLPNGQQYLPDFHLEELGTWVEVKGPGVPRIEKPITFARWREDSLVVAGLSPDLVPGQGFKMRFRGVVDRCGFALCPHCGRYQWATIALTCRACEAHIPESSFYRHNAAPFYPAPWAGE